MARAKEKTIWKILTPENAENITLEEVKNALWGENPDRVNFADFCGKGTPLCYAVCTGRMDIVRYFVEELKVDIVKPQNNTPLQVALSKGNMEMVEYFFEIDPLIGGSDYQANCIRATIWGRQLEMLKFLVETKHFFIGNEKNDEPLRSSVCCGWEFFKYLIDHGAVPTDRVVEEAAGHGAAGTTDYTEKDAVRFRILKYLLEQTGIKYSLYEAVQRAICQKNLECVKYLFSKGASVKTKKDEDGWRTPLLFTAANYNDIEMMKFLISQGADIHEKDERNGSILENIRWKDKNLSTLKYIVDDLNFFDGLEKDCSMCKFETLAPLKFLLEHGLTYSDSENRENFKHAVRNGDLPLVKYLVEELKFPIDPIGDVKRSILLEIYNLDTCNYENFLYLVENSTSVNVQDCFGNSILDEALDRCSRRCFKSIPEKQKGIIKLLLKKGAIPPKRIHNQAILTLLNECIAELQNELPPEKLPAMTIDMLEDAMDNIMSDGLKKMKSLLAHGLQVPQEVEGIPTLGFIAQKDKDKLLKYFVEEKNFDVNYRDSKGRTPLIYFLIKAISWGGEIDIECLSYLLDQKADVNYEDKNGISALQYACLLCREDRVEAIKALIRHGAKYQKLLRKENPFIIEALKEIKQEKKKSVQEK